MSDEKNVLLNNLATLSNLDNIQKYILGTKRNGQPRAVYDIIKDYSHPKRKHHKNEPNTYSIYLQAKAEKKKKHRKHKGHNKKYWHI